MTVAECRNDGMPQYRYLGVGRDDGKEKGLVKQMAELSPMMQHYLDTKEKYKDCILFYRLGDFYEMFYDDAIMILTTELACATTSMCVIWLPAHELILRCNLYGFIVRLLQQPYGFVSTDY